jgi:LysR family transcriptional regulator, cyn operon transcriptional activator
MPAGSSKIAPRTVNSLPLPRADLDVRALRYFLEVVRLGSFTKAAESLHVAQPALSVTVKKLEERLGVVLVIRESRQVVPTAEGRILMEHARRVLEQVESARLAVEDAIDLKRGDVRVGLPPMFGLAHLPVLLAGFHAKYPGLTVTALEASADETADLLDRGAVDVAILERRRLKPEWAHVPLGEDELVLGVAKTHPLAARVTISASDLDGLDMAVFDGTFVQRAILDAFCKPVGAKPRIVLVSNFVPLVTQAAVDGVGAATLLRALAESIPGLAAVSFAPRQVLRFSLCWRSELYLSNANRAFVEFVKAAHGR